MVCRNCKLELPVYAKYCPSCGMQVHMPHVHHDLDATKGREQEAHARHVDWLFEPVHREIEQRLEEPDVEKTELYETAHRIESEALKGEAANPDKIARWLKLYSAVAPDILALTVAVLLKPDAGVAPAIQKVVEGFKPEPVY
jgi:hypothetical protein